MKTGRKKRGFTDKSAAAFGAALLLLAPSAYAAEPLQGKTIYIDAGHGGEDSGAGGNGLLEKNINLAVSNKVIAKLETEGAKPVASRTDDTFTFGRAGGESKRQPIRFIRQPPYEFSRINGIGHGNVF